MVEFLVNLVNGLSLGSVYAIIALGYTMVYGIAKMLNFAHGDIIMVGAYMAYVALRSLNMPPLVATLIAMLVCTLLGITIEKTAYKPLRQSASLAVLITAIGVSYFLQNMVDFVNKHAITDILFANNLIHASMEKTCQAYERYLTQKPTMQHEIQ